MLVQNVCSRVISLQVLGCVSIRLFLYLMMQNGYSGLMIAAEVGNVKCVLQLLEAGANIHLLSKVMSYILRGHVVSVDC